MAYIGQPLPHSEEEKSMYLRIPGNTSSRQTIEILSNTLSRLGVEIRLNNQFNYYSGGDNEIIIRMLKKNDLFFYREEIAASIEDKIRRDIENERKNQFKSGNKKTNDDLTDLIMDTVAEVKKMQEEYKKISDLDKEPSYEEKVAWFCKKYNENYSIMIDSLRDDNLDNLFWDGERVKFPKMRRDL